MKFVKLKVHKECVSAIGNCKRYQVLGSLVNSD